MLLTPIDEFSIYQLMTYTITFFIKGEMQQAIVQICPKPTASVQPNSKLDIGQTWISKCPSGKFRWTPLVDGVCCGRGLALPRRVGAKTLTHTNLPRGDSLTCILPRSTPFSQHP